MDSRVKKAMCVFGSVLLVIFLYIVLHEGGHMIVMLSAGATITDFSILTAHVSGVGGNYTNTSDLWLHANGALLPVIVSFIYMVLYSKESKNMFYRVFSYMFCLVPVASMLAWIIIPVTYMQGGAPSGDDVTKFLYNFTHDYHPLFVSGAAAVIIAVGVVIMIKKEIIKNFIIEIKQN
jgi:hypothetical protein